jgi:hypothetical protein
MSDCLIIGHDKDMASYAKECAKYLNCKVFVYDGYYGAYLKTAAGPTSHDPLPGQQEGFSTCIRPAAASQRAVPK